MLEILLIEIGSALIILGAAILVSIKISNAIKEQGSKKIEVVDFKGYQALEKPVADKKIKSRADVKELTQIALENKPTKVNIKTDTMTFDDKSK